MKPDRSNYEIGLIDWLDGNLDEARTEQLRAFLDENPDLREEADSLSLTRIVPENGPSIAKSMLKKSPKDLPLPQIEFLSVAYLENDLSAEQIKDLKENIADNPDSRMLFETMQKTRLKPGDYRFRYKNRLLRKPLSERILRISAIGLSAAAAVTVLIVSFLALPRTFKTEQESIAMNPVKDTIVIRSGNILNNKENVAYIEEMTVRINSPEIALPDITVAEDQNTVYISENPETLPERNTEYFVSAVPVLSGFEASIGGLNKLLGWEMALVKTTDDEGEMQSYYFSSRVLRFNAPVKKSNPSLYLFRYDVRPGN